MNTVQGTSETLNKDRQSPALSTSPRCLGFSNHGLEPDQAKLLASSTLFPHHNILLVPCFTHGIMASRIVHSQKGP